MTDSTTTGPTALEGADLFDCEPYLGTNLSDAEPATHKGIRERTPPAARLPTADVPIVTAMSRSLSVREGSDLLGFHSGTAVLRLIHAGLLPAVKVSGRWVIDESDLIDLLRSHPLADQ